MSLNHLGAARLKCSPGSGDCIIIIYWVYDKRSGEVNPIFTSINFRLSPFLYTMLLNDMFNWCVIRVGFKYMYLDLYLSTQFAGLHLYLYLALGNPEYLGL